MKVILDYDDVLNECNEEAVRRLNEEYGYSYSVEDITDWGILGNNLDKRLSYFDQPDFTANIPVKSNARKFVCDLLKRNCEVFIATSVPSQCAGARVTDIIKHFPEIDPGNILIGSRKDLLAADILLDDRYHNIKNSKVHYPVLFRKPWNMQHTGVPAISDYKGFLSLVDMLLKTQKRLNNFCAPNIFVLIGPSASGKTTIQNKLLETGEFIRTKSCTTRSPRGKKDSDYKFLSVSEFKEMEANEEFIETTFYKGDYYGTSQEEFLCCLNRYLNTGKKLVFVMDINGALRIKNLYRKRACTIFIKRKPLDCIHSILDRLQAGETTKEDAADRLNSLYAEYENEKFCDMTIINDTIKNVVNEIMRIK